MNKIMFGAGLTLFAFAVQASSMRDLETSAIVNGTIVLATDGSVQSAVIDHPEKYGQPIANLVRNAALKWRFHPVLREGQPVMAKASMHARVVLRKTADGNYTVRIKGATFGDNDLKSTDALLQADSNKNIKPHYPEAAIHERVQGTVYLSLHVDHNGRVIDAVALQVNLQNLGPEYTLKRYRQVLADAALKTARQWTFQVPTTGPLAQQDSWTADVPFNFSLNEWGRPESERVWVSYVPGPYTPAPWVDKSDINDTDAVADDNVRTEGASPTLLSPISHN
jgi:hypothetical protein